MRAAPCRALLCDRKRDPGLDRSLASLSLPEPYALFIGRLTDEKGALQAAAATARLRREGLNLGLALVGDASPEFSRFYERLGESARAAIRPLGRVEEVQKHALLSTCMMLLLPSRADAFGLVLLEAWSHGRPVIGARAGGIPGVIDHGRDGLLVPYGDVDALAAAMRRLFLNEAERRAMGQAGRQKIATEYRWPQVVDRVLLSYERALHPAASRA